MGDINNYIEDFRLASYSFEIKFESSKPIKEQEISLLIEKLCNELGKEYIKHGAGLIGHIKCFASSEQGYMRASLVSLEAGAEITGSISPTHKGKIYLLAAMQGIEEQELSDIGYLTVQKILKRFGFHVIIEKYSAHKE